MSDDIEREGNEALARLPELPDVRWGMSNIGDGWKVTLRRTTAFKGATADEAVNVALAAATAPQHPDPHTHAGSAALEGQELPPGVVEHPDPVREALAFYAESVNYAPQNPPGTGSPIWRDAGKRARAALADPPLERVEQERDEALDLLERIWNEGPRFKTLRLTDWLRERGIGPARVEQVGEDERE